MNIAQLDNELRQSGLNLCVLGSDKLKLVGPRSKMTTRIVEAIRTHKIGLITYLRSNQREALHDLTDNTVLVANPPKMTAYRLVVDGIPMTMITPSKEPIEQIMLDVKQRFQQYNVDSLGACLRIA